MEPLLHLTLAKVFYHIPGHLMKPSQGWELPCSAEGATTVVTPGGLSSYLADTDFLARPPGGFIKSGATGMEPPPHLTLAKVFHHSLGHLLKPSQG